MRLRVSAAAVVGFVGLEGRTLSDSIRYNTIIYIITSVASRTLFVVKAMTAVAGFMFGMHHVLDDKTVKLYKHNDGNMYGMYDTSIQTTVVLTPSGSR